MAWSLEFLGFPLGLSHVGAPAFKQKEEVGKLHGWLPPSGFQGDSATLWVPGASGRSPTAFPGGFPASAGAGGGGGGCVRARHPKAAAGPASWALLVPGTRLGFEPRGRHCDPVRETLFSPLHRRAH